jgi:hypothetical protein
MTAASASLEKLTGVCPNANEVVFGFTVKRRDKPAYPNEDGTIWGTRPVIVIKAHGEIVSELPELGEQP